MAESTLCFCENTQTLRLLPSNALVAFKYAEGRWIMDADPIVPLAIVQKVTEALHTSHDVKWGSGLKLLAAVTPTWEGIEEYAVPVRDYEMECRVALTTNGWMHEEMEGKTAFDKLVDAFVLMNEGTEKQ